MLDGRRSSGFNRGMVGRKKEFEKRITLPLSQEMLGRVDRLLGEGEARLDFIRIAIDREVLRREAEASSS